MKKVFSIISACLILFISVLLITLSFVKKNVNLSLNEPTQILIYDHATTAKTIRSSDENYKETLQKFNNITNLTLMDWILNKKTLDIVPTQDVNSKFSTYNTDMKNQYLVVEFDFSTKMQDIKLRINGNTKIISFYRILFVLPSDNRFSNIVAYYATTNDDYENSYIDCRPIVINGRAGDFIKFIKNV